MIAENAVTALQRYKKTYLDYGGPGGWVKSWRGDRHRARSLKSLHKQEFSNFGTFVEKFNT